MIEGQMFFAPYYDTQEEYITFSQELHQPKIKIRQMDSHAGMNPSGEILSQDIPKLNQDTYLL